MRKVLVVAVAAVSLAGCDQLSGLGAVQAPHRKPGLWEQTSTSDRSPTPIVTKWCFDAASDRQMPVFGRRQRPGGGAGPAARACSKPVITQANGSYTIDGSCSFAGAKATNHAVISGDFSSKYTITTTVNVQGAPDPARNGAHIITTTAVYQGDCPPELQPGQVECPDGSVIEMASMRGRGGCGRVRFGGGPGGSSNAATNAAQSGGGPPPPSGGPP